MRLSRMGCVLLALILFTSAATALKVDVTGEKAWLVAGGGPGGLSLEISGGNGPFTVTTATNGLCRVDPLSQTITTNRPDPLSIIPLETSGVCQIDVKVTAQNGQTATARHLQNIDHAAPYRYDMVYWPVDVTVGTHGVITGRLSDVYNNSVDNRNVAETVSFVTSATRSGFVDVSAFDADPDNAPIERYMNVTVDGWGFTTVLYLVEEEGLNYFIPTPPNHIKMDQPAYAFYGHYDGDPAAISTVIVPSASTPPWVYADGTSRFTVTYTLMDVNGYPCEGRDLRIETPLGDKALTTNTEGQVSFYYPSTGITTPGLHTLKATAVVNTSATTSDNVEFISGRAANLMVSANPVSMPSLDVEPNQRSEINGRVSDIKGNPKTGESVTFELISYTEDVGNLTHPYLTDVQGRKYGVDTPFTVTTNIEGTALMYFHPGKFQPDPEARLTDAGAPEFNPDATGTAEVKASWNGKSEVITLTWKNTPFLSITTDVSPKVLRVDDEFVVNITVRGNGAKLTGLPVDVILVIDRSGSMWNSVPGDANRTQRLAFVKEGAAAFIDSLEPGKDRVGLVSFETRASLDHPLTSNFDSVKAVVQDLSIPRFDAPMVPYKGQPGASNLRDGLYKAVKAIENDPMAGSGSRVKAIVVLSDGEFNWYGTPLANGRGYALKTLINKCYQFEDANCPSPATTEDTLWWPALLMPQDYTYYNDLGGPLIYTGDSCRKTTGTQPYKEFAGSCGELCYPSYTAYGMKYTGNWFPSGVNVWQTTHQDPCPGNNYRIQICEDDRCLFTKQNMSIYATSVGAEIYSIGFAEDFNTPRFGVTRDILTILAEATGGKYYGARTGADLKEVYKKIGKDLIRSAGISASIDTAHSNVKVGGQVVSGGVYKYVYRAHREPYSTLIHSWNLTPDGTENHIDGPRIVDQGTLWNADALTVPIGTMTIGQVWTMNYVLKATKPGWAEVFGPAAVLKFKNPVTGAEESVPFPQQNVTVRDKGEPLGNVNLDVIDPRAELDGERVSSVPEDTSFSVNWELNFQDDDNGRAEQGFIITKVSDPTFRKVHVHPILAKPNNGPETQGPILFMGGLKEGRYKITVYGRDGSFAYDDEEFYLDVGPRSSTAVIILR